MLKIEIKKIEDLLMRNYSKYLAEEQFVFSCCLETEYLIAKLDLNKNDNSFRYTMEFMVSMNDHNFTTTSEAKDTILDFISFYLDKYFKEKRELLLPLDWQKHDFGDSCIFARGDILYPQLDAMADEIIARGTVLTTEK